MTKRPLKIAKRDISQLLSICGVPDDKMSFLFRTPYGDVHIHYGYIKSGSQKAIGHLMFTLQKPGVKIDMDAMNKQQKGFINSVKSFFKKK